MHRLTARMPYKSLGPCMPLGTVNKEMKVTARQIDRIQVIFVLTLLGLATIGVIVGGLGMTFHWRFPL